MIDHTGIRVTDVGRSAHVRNANSGVIDHYGAPQRSVSRVIECRSRNGR